MNRRDAMICYVLVVCALLGGLISRAAETVSGSWTIARSLEAGKVEFTLIHNQHGHSSNHESTWPVSAFVGLDLSKPGKQEVKFAVNRDAYSWRNAGMDGAAQKGRVLWN